MDIEDINFLQDLAEELRRIDNTYEAEAIELENIIHREFQFDAEEIINLVSDFNSLNWWIHTKDFEERYLELEEG